MKTSGRPPRRAHGNAQRRAVVEAAKRAPGGAHGDARRPPRQRVRARLRKGDWS